VEQGVDISELAKNLEATPFYQELPKLIQWFEQKKDSVPQIEAIFSVAFGPPYQHKTTIAFLTESLDKFIGIKHTGITLILLVALNGILEIPKVQELMTPAFQSWIEGLKPRFSDSALSALNRDQTPGLLYKVDFGHEENSVLMRMERRDGGIFEFSIPYENVPGFISRVLESFCKGGGPKKVAEKEIEKLQDVIKSALAKKDEK